MKKFAVFVVTAVLLLTGCGAQATVPPVESPDIDALIQQSVDEAIQKTVDQYEAERQAREEEIAALKTQIEELSSQLPEEAEPSEETSPPPASFAPEETAPSVTPEEAFPPPASSTAPEDTEPEPIPPSDPVPQSSPSSPGQGFDLKNLYPSFVFDEAYRNDGTPDDNDDDDTEPVSEGVSCEEKALEVIRLTNEERVNQGLEPLEMDSDLMVLAQIRAEEVSTKYSHERPDGTRVVKEYPGTGENVGAKASAEKQVASWMSSEGHRANILKEKYHSIGVGCYQTAGGKHYWVQIFRK